MGIFAVILAIVLIIAAITWIIHKADSKTSYDEWGWLAPTAHKRAKAPFVLWFTGQKPLDIPNYHRIVRKAIRSKLYKDINNKLYANHIIGNEMTTHIEFVIRNQNFLPMGFEQSFHGLFKDEIIKVIKDYANNKYDVSIQSYDDRIHLLIIPKITNISKK